MKYENKSVPRNLTYAKVYQRALEFFEFDKDKTNSFWMTKTEHLDGMSPYEMVKNGMGRKLMDILRV